MSPDRADTSGGLERGWNGASGMTVVFFATDGIYVIRSCLVASETAITASAFRSDGGMSRRSSVLPSEIMDSGAFRQIRS